MYKMTLDIFKIQDPLFELAMTYISLGLYETLGLVCLDSINRYEVDTELERVFRHNSNFPWIDQWTFELARQFSRINALGVREVI